MPFTLYRSIEEMSMFTKSMHFGQRKLLLGEILYFTLCGSPNEPVTVIYAGAAPCEHIYILLDMFPNFNFILIDGASWNSDFVKQHPDLGRVLEDKDMAQLLNPKKYVIADRDRPGSRVTVYHGWFTDQLATTLGREHSDRKVLFLSDIRDLNVNIKAQTMAERATLVEREMEQQRTWFELLQKENKEPQNVWCMLKFKPNFEIPKEKYLDGWLFYQAYAPLLSPELRIISNTTHLVQYNTKWLESHLAWFNTVLRNRSVWNKPGFNDNFDTMFEYDILRSYLEKFGGVHALKNIMKCMWNITKLLKMYSGGKELSGTNYKLPKGKQEIFQQGYMLEPWRLQQWKRRIVEKNLKFGNSE
jgi:hypothetical protein